jgi:hypothetical protein
MTVCENKATFKKKEETVTKHKKLETLMKHYAKTPGSSRK